MARLRKYGAEGRLIEILKELYLSPEAALRVNGRFSDFYQLPLGVLQGDPISPLLFVVYMSALCTSDPDDPSLSGISIPELMLADDIWYPPHLHAAKARQTRTFLRTKALTTPYQRQD
jgi:hypothetical protein